MVRCKVSMCFTGEPKKGGGKFITFKFPDDSAARTAWIKALKIDPRWVPTKHDRICELHFTEDCFVSDEKNVFKDYHKKRRKNLLPHAVPTLFPDKTKPRTGQYFSEEYNNYVDESGLNKDVSKIIKNLKPTKIIQNLHPKSYPEEDDLPPPKEENFTPKKLKTESSEVVDGESNLNPPVSESDSESESIFQTVQKKNLSRKRKKDLENPERVIEILRKENELMRNKIKELKFENQAMRKVFKPDQIDFLTKDQSLEEAVWTTGTIFEAEKLRSVLGNQGFEYLRQLGYPFPPQSVIQQVIKIPDMKSKKLKFL